MFVLSNVMPRHGSSVRVGKEIYTKTAVVGIVTIHGPNSLNCPVTPGFLAMVYFPY